MVETVNDSKLIRFIWENPNPMPPCGKECPFYWLWEEEEKDD